MTESLLALVPQYGLWLLAVCTYCSCLALPIPASMIMLAAGGFVSAGDLSLTGSALAALCGAVAGDQTGYFGGRWIGPPLLERLGSRGAPVVRAANLLSARGTSVIFLSRWLMSALGPYVNLAAGVAGLNWWRFTLWGLAGEAVWVGLYISLGYVFTGNLAAASSMALNMLGFISAGVVALGLGAWLRAVARAHKEVRP